jgi:hypothetical protein
MGMNSTRWWARRRAKAAIGIVTALAALGIVVVAAPAQAAPQACSGEVNVNVCLAIEPYNNAGHGGLFRIHVGIDFRITQQDAQAIIDTQRDPYFVEVLGDDGASKSEQFPVPETTIIAHPTAGLSAGFDTIVFASQLREDDHGEQELQARVIFTDPRGILGTRVFDSPDFVGVF